MKPRSTMTSVAITCGAFTIATALLAASASSVAGSEPQPSELSVLQQSKPVSTPLAMPTGVTPSQTPRTVEAEAADRQVVSAFLPAMTALTQPTAQGTALAAAVAAATPATPPVGPETGPTRWTGPTLRHPDGSKLPPEVTRWAIIVQAVMAEQKIPARHLEGILAQIAQESMGDPKATNRSDGNAAMGTPSMGLLQVIAPTYSANAKPGFENTRYQTVPYTNIWAALHYVKRAYGMEKFNNWSNGSNEAY